LTGKWEDIQQTFIVETQLGTNFHVSFVIVPIDSIVHPLCVIRMMAAIRRINTLLYYPKDIGLDILAIISICIKERHVHK
jgi:hypothetical protein